MADFDAIKSQLENNPSNFDLDSIKDIQEELDKVINALTEIRAANVKWTDDHRKVLEAAIKYRNELEKAKGILDDSSESAEKLGGKIGNIFDKASGGLKNIQRIVEGGFFEPIKKLSKAWGDADQAANNFGKRIGLNAKGVAQLRDETIKFANDTHIGAKYNTDIKEMIELQSKYTQSVGRNLQITDKQKETLLATSRLMGDKAVDFSKKLENLGIGLERSGDLAAKMFNEASKSGISFEKYSTSVTENLTKVQSYGFRNGVEGLTAMAKKAAEVNLNIQEAFKVADKIQTGGIQESIKMGANLQVLGGSFARMGDPMGMLYQGLNDMEGLQDRMIKMFSGLGQIVNGQVKISGANRLRVNAAAQAMGISNDEMFNMINRQAVRDQVSRQLGGRFNDDEELKELVLNTATLNKDNEAVVNINGKEKKLSEVDAKDKQLLKDMQKTQSEDIKDIAQILRGYTDVQSGFTKEIENKKASAFSEIGKFTKGLYGKMGESNVMLTIIKDAVLAQALISGASNITSGFSGIIGGIKKLFGGKGAGGVGGGAGSMAEAASGGGVGGAGTPTGGSRGGALGGAGKSILRGWGGAGIGGVAGGAFAALGYAADGSWKSNQMTDKNRAIGGTAGAAIGGAALGAIFGPVGMMIGTEAGKFIGEAAGKWFDNKRAKKKTELTEELSKKDEERGKAFANLSDSYSRRDLKKIKKAMEDGVITEGELSDRIMKKLAKAGDKDLIQKYGSDKAKAKINEQIEKLNAKIENGKFDMETGEFRIGNADFGKIEPVAYAAGGKVEGPSDINGPGVPVIMGGNEFVVNAQATAKNEPILNAINNGAEFDFSGPKSISVEPVKMASGGKPVDKVAPSTETGKGLQMPIKISNILPSLLKNPMTPLPVKAIKAAGEFMSDKFEKFGKMEVAPVKLDVSGTIKLDSGGKQVDLNAIINNPAFLTQLSQMIERRLSDNINGGNFKELRKNKQHNF